MVIKDISIDEFIFHILSMMEVPEFNTNTRVQLAFYGKSSKFPLRVKYSEKMDKVYKNICSIEEQRKLSKQGTPGQDDTDKFPGSQFNKNSP